MFYGMDTLSPGVTPVRNDTSGLALYFIAWMFIGSFFALNLFVGVVVDNFNRIKAVKDGSAHLTEAQAQWVDTMKASMGQKPKIKIRAQGFLGGVLFPIMQVRAAVTASSVSSRCPPAAQCPTCRPTLATCQPTRASCRPHANLVPAANIGHVPTAILAACQPRTLATYPPRTLATYRPPSAHPPA